MYFFFSKNDIFGFYFKLILKVKCLISKSQIPCMYSQEVKQNMASVAVN